MFFLLKYLYLSLNTFFSLSFAFCCMLVKLKKKKKHLCHSYQLWHNFLGRGTNLKVLSICPLVCLVGWLVADGWLELVVNGWLVGCRWLVGWLFMVGLISCWWLVVIRRISPKLLNGEKNPMEDGSGSRIDPIHLPYGVNPDKRIFSLLKKIWCI